MHDGRPRAVRAAITTTVPTTRSSTMTDQPPNDMPQLFALQRAITDSGGTLIPDVHTAVDALRNFWDAALQQAQQAAAPGRDAARQAAGHQPETCRAVEVDGTAVLVRGNGDWTDEDQHHMAEVVRAAKRRYEAEHPVVEQPAEAQPADEAPADTTAAIEMWARLLNAADIHVYGSDHPTWQQLPADLQDQYRKAAQWLMGRAIVPPEVIRAKHYREAADAVQNHPGPIPYRPQLDEDGGYWWDTRDRDAAADLLRRMADEETR